MKKRVLLYTVAAAALTLNLLDAAERATAASLDPQSIVTNSAAGPEVNTTITGLALRGYDPVAYFTDNEPILGAFTIATVYNGAIYRFSTQEHKDMFLKAPEKYLPQFGGFCAYGTASGAKVDGDPTVWKIVDEKLYLNFAPPVEELWLKDTQGHIATANEKWNTLKNMRPSELQK